MKHIIVISIVLIFFGCKNTEGDMENGSSEVDSTNIIGDVTEKILQSEPLVLTLSEANKLATLPLECINTEYPNKLGQTIATKEDIAEPSELHPAFYGCFDWHSSVHGHWALVSLLKQFPDLEKAEDIKKALATNISKENI